MPKVSDYEVEHLADQCSFEKIRRKSKGKTGDQNPKKEKKHREKKIDY